MRTARCLTRHPRDQRGRARRPRLVESRIEQLPFPDGSFDVVLIVTVLCLVDDRAGVVREAARVLSPGGLLVIGDLGRWSAWAARRRVRAWLGSELWQSAHFSTARGLSRVVQSAGLVVEAVRGSVYYPPIGVLARPLARCDWLGTITTVGAAFIALAARKPATGVSTRTWPCEDRGIGDEQRRPCLGGPPRTPHRRPVRWAGGVAVGAGRSVVQNRCTHSNRVQPTRVPARRRRTWTNSGSYTNK